MIDAPHHNPKISLKSANQVQQDLAATVPEPRNDYELIKQGLLNAQPIYRDFNNGQYDGYEVCREPHLIDRMTANARFTRPPQIGDFFKTRPLSENQFQPQPKCYELIERDGKLTKLCILPPNMFSDQ